MPLPLLSALRVVAATLMLGCFALGAQAGLTWETLRIAQTAPAGATEVVGLYRFANTGNSPVTITSLQPTCGCTTATLDKRTYAPGEAGEIKATLHIGNRVGLQEKVIQIVTDAPDERPTTLVLAVDIPELLTYVPRLLHWKKVDAPDWKSALLNAGTALSIRTITLAPPSKEVLTELEAVEEGRSYRLKIKPAVAGQPINVTVAGTAVLADGTKVPFSLYALVR